MPPARPLAPSPADRMRHVRPPRRVAFAAFEEMPETKRHLRLRTALFESVTRAFSDRAWLGSDQFVYWDASDDRRKLAPDVLVRLGGPDEDFETWRTWERGAPHLCVEIVSRSDRAELPWAEKLRRYRQAGVEELVRYDSSPVTGRRLRVWDRLEGDLVERSLRAGQPVKCRTLGLFWVEGPGGKQRGLRLAHDSEGKHLLLTPDEAEKAAEQRAGEEARARAMAEQRAGEEAGARAAAEARAGEEARARAMAERKARALEKKLAELEGKAAKGKARRGQTSPSRRP